jgi:predicted nucleotide-binding protein
MSGLPSNQTASLETQLIPMTPEDLRRTLMAAVESCDFAVFVLLPEDHTDNRGQEALTVRDNVIFELGLFLGKLGRARNFFMISQVLAPASCCHWRVARWRALTAERRKGGS